MRAAIAAESAGIPSVSIVCDGFVGQASATGRGLGYDGLSRPVYAVDDFGDAEGETSLVFPPSDEKNDSDDDVIDARGVDLSEFEPGSKVVMDWKGEPMVIRPGDKLPNVQ